MTERDSGESEISTEHESFQKLMYINIEGLIKQEEGRSLYVLKTTMRKYKSFLERKRLALLKTTVPTPVTVPTVSAFPDLPTPPTPTTVLTPTTVPTPPTPTTVLTPPNRSYASVAAS